MCRRSLSVSDGLGRDRVASVITWANADPARLVRRPLIAWSLGCTNQMESLFSRLRRAEKGVHHRIAGPYLLAYAGENAWREDFRSSDSASKADMIVGMAMTAGVSPVWKGYWQRRKGDPMRFDIWAHVRDDSLSGLMH